MNTAQFQQNVMTEVNDIETALEVWSGYTETLTFPGYDMGNGDNLLWEAHPTKRSRVRAVMGYHYTEANTDAIFRIGVGGADIDAYIEEITTAAVSANTQSTTDADAAYDQTRFILPGAAYVIPADQLVTLDATDGGSDTGIFTLVVVLEHFL